ncbi:MAG: peptidylprolyl isomerase [Ferrovibrio sp.]|uniref:peptidylprolyl isomerase n=1 Tax=Ferrovibrio sp. TaxID=1917215 RepID=UPI00261C3251|nr:peptidylprolyl isomerase [Ferrovibrio sp.]MCW0234792.1 peptidylprolyl isomerase [Ferrovibrio sp.]
MEVIRVNGAAIDEAAVLAEMQYHPAASAEEAGRKAAEALAVRELLLQRAEALGHDREDEDAIDRVIAAEVSLPAPDEKSCRRYYEANRSQFRSPTLYEARHILIPAMPEEEEEREAARLQAEKLIALLKSDPELFGQLAKEYSACSSKDNGGHLGQFASDTTVPEFETFLDELQVGQLSPAPVPTRYGFHVLQLIQREPGRDLPYDSVQQRVVDYLCESVFRTAVRQYIAMLAAEAEISGVALAGAESPLVQ